MEDRVSWSKGGQILFLDKKAWGIAPSLRTVCLGEEDKIVDALENHKPTGNKTLENIFAMDINSRGVDTTTTVRRSVRHNKRHKG